MISELRCSGGFCDALFNAHAQSVSTSELEGRELGRRVLLIVDGELRQPQPICPMFLFFGTEEPKVLLYFSVHHLHLSICLRVMRCGELGRNTEPLAEVRHDLRGKLWTPITNNGVREAMIFPDME